MLRATLTSMTTCTITATTRTFPELPYQKMKDAILGTTYQVSLVFVGAKRAQELNQATRNKSYVPNVLSFPLDSAHGEIYIAPVVAKKEASKFNLSYEGYVGYLFIHGLLHLQGHDHGNAMEALEKKYLTTYHLK